MYFETNIVYFVKLYGFRKAVTFKIYNFVFYL